MPALTGKHRGEGIIPCRLSEEFAGISWRLKKMQCVRRYQTCILHIAKKTPPPGRGLTGFGGSGRFDVFSLVAFRAGLHFVAYLLAFLQGAEAAAALDRAEMHEDILAAAVGRDETKALGVVKPLHSPGLHST